MKIPSKSIFFSALTTITLGGLFTYSFPLLSTNNSVGETKSDFVVKDYNRSENTLRKKFNDQTFIFDSFNFPLQSELKISKSENSKFVYIIVDAHDIDTKTFKVEVKNGMVSVSAETKKNPATETEYSFARPNFHPRTYGKFPVPSGTDGNKLEIEKKDLKIIIKFPKNRSNKSRRPTL